MLPRLSTLAVIVGMLGIAAIVIFISQPQISNSNKSGNSSSSLPLSSGTRDEASNMPPIREIADSRPFGELSSKQTVLTLPRAANYELSALEREYYEIEAMTIQALLMPLADLKWATENEHWNPSKKKLTEENLNKLKRALEVWREDIRALEGNFYAELNTVAHAELLGGKLRPVNSSKIDTRKLPGYEKLVLSRGNDNYVFDVIPNQAEALQPTWATMLRSKIDLDNKLRWFFQDIR